MGVVAARFSLKLRISDRAFRILPAASEKVLLLAKPVRGWSRLRMHSQQPDVLPDMGHVRIICLKVGESYGYPL